MSSFSRKKSSRTQSTLPYVVRFQPKNSISRRSLSDKNKYRYGHLSLDAETQSQNIHEIPVSKSLQKQSHHPINRYKINNMTNKPKSKTINVHKLYTISTQNDEAEQKIIANQQKQNRIQAIYYPKNFRKNKNSIAYKRKQTQLALPTNETVDLLDSDHEELKTITQQITKNRDKPESHRNYMVQDKKQVIFNKQFKNRTQQPQIVQQQSRVNFNIPNTPNTPHINIQQLFKNAQILQKVQKPSDTGESWIKNHYQPHTQLFKSVDKSSFTLKRYHNGAYLGQFNQKGQKHGFGIVFYNNGKLFEGNFINDIKNGQGYQLYPDGSSYHGNYQDGNKSGKGKFLWINGEIYEGQWKNGKKHGSGLWENRQTKSSYIGQWKDGVIQGFGILIDESKSRYQGQFLNSMKHGKGTLRLLNGDTYVGQFRKNVPNGSGQYFWINGDYYKGHFCNGVRHGTGMQTFHNKTIYKGDFRNDKKCGYGQQQYADGSKYIGNFQNNYRHGYGVLSNEDNTAYRGYWLNNYPVKDAQTPIIIQDNRDIIQSVLAAHSKQKVKMSKSPNMQNFDEPISHKLHQHRLSIKQLKAKQQNLKRERSWKQVGKTSLQKIKSNVNLKQQLNSDSCKSLQKNFTRACRCHKKH